MHEVLSPIFSMKNPASRLLYSGRPCPSRACYSHVKTKDISV